MKKTVSLYIKNLIFATLITLNFNSNAGALNACWQSAKILGGASFISLGVLSAHKNIDSTIYALSFCKTAHDITWVSSRFLASTLGYIALGSILIRDGNKNMKQNKKSKLSIF